MIWLTWKQGAPASDEGCAEGEGATPSRNRQGKGSSAEYVRSLRKTCLEVLKKKGAATRG